MKVFRKDHEDRDSSAYNPVVGCMQALLSSEHVQHSEHQGVDQAL